MNSKIVLITGGAGFIGSELIRYLVANTNYQIINIDKLTYAGNLESLTEVSNNTRYHFEHIDICNTSKLSNIFKKYEPQLVMHLAAESHVDRSILGPSEFIKTNIFGTYNMLECARFFWDKLNPARKDLFRFHHISTDEVYGDLQVTDNLFKETNSYKPSSPYAASKASSDHLVRAWHRTYGLPVVITNCSNNYGPFHFPEKLIPLTILNALAGKPIRVYGSGKQIRDWLYVEDHARALHVVATKGKIGETYNIGGHNQKTNIDVINDICDLLEELAPNKPAGIHQYKDLIQFVKDRPGHDFRYAIDATKIQADLGWKPIETFRSGLRKTVQWYIDNQKWAEKIKSINNLA